MEITNAAVPLKSSIVNSDFSEIQTQSFASSLNEDIPTECFPLLKPHRFWYSGGWYNVNMQEKMIREAEASYGYHTLWLHLLSVFEVCFEGVAETFGVFDKLLFLVLQGLRKQRIKRNTVLKKQGQREKRTQECVCVSVTYSAILVLIFLNDIVDCVQELFYGAGYVSVGNQQQHKWGLSCVCYSYRTENTMLFLHQFE